MISEIGLGTTFTMPGRDAVHEAREVKTITEWPSAGQAAACITSAPPERAWIEPPPDIDSAESRVYRNITHRPDTFRTGINVPNYLAESNAAMTEAEHTTEKEPTMNDYIAELEQRRKRISDGIFAASQVNGTTPDDLAGMRRARDEVEHQIAEQTTLLHVERRAECLVCGHEWSGDDKPLSNCPSCGTPQVRVTEVPRQSIA